MSLVVKDLLIEWLRRKTGASRIFIGDSDVPGTYMAWFVRPGRNRAYGVPFTDPPNRDAIVREANSGLDAIDLQDTAHVPNHLEGLK